MTEQAKVLICTPVDQVLYPDWVEGLQRLIAYSSNNGVSVGPAMNGNIRVEVAREQLAETVLKAKGITHMLFLDSDVVMPSDGLVKLLKEDKAIISGVYYNRSPKTLFHPQTWEKNTSKIGGEYAPKDVEDKILKVDAVGMGACLIKTIALRKVRKPRFEWGYKNSNLSEDLGFCKKAQEAKLEIWAHGGVQCGHIGLVSITRQHWLAAKPHFEKLAAQRKD